MKLSNNFLVILSEFILAITYSVIMFSLVPIKDDAFYVNYAFTCISFILTTCVSLSIFDKKTNLHDLFYRFPLFSITILYGVCQLILSGILAYNEVSYQGTLSISSIVLCLYLTSVISTVLINRFHLSTDQTSAEETSFLHYMKLALLDIQQDVLDKKVQIEVENLNEMITYSDPVSLAETKTLENDIIKFIQEIHSKTVSIKDILKLKKMLEKRNNLLKELKTM